ncbi:MAG: HAMP domain-containing methyl-accepting chemotaxis protein [Nitrospiraceae bacterium]|nr:HAMP domain-containing methyl-accepting chemotaxis protein [Nitrospiraceae bacterium]
MIFRKSITTKFISGFMLIFLVGQSLGGVFLISFTRSALLDSLEKRIRRAAATTAGISSGPLQSYDYAMLDVYLEEVMKDEDITSVRIYDNNDKVVRESVKAASREISSVNPFLISGTLRLTVPVTASGNKIGEVRIDYSGKSINSSITDSMITIVLYQVLMLMTIGVFMIYLFNRNIKKPVSEINRAVQKITVGDLSVEVPSLGDNEIGTIAQGVKFLLERLMITVSKLNSTAVNVSMAIRQVNLTYNNVTEGMTRQSGAVRDITKAIQNASKAQADISDSSEKMANFSVENVSSLIELKATAEEIAANTQRLLKATEDLYSVVSQITQSARAISKTAGGALTAVEDTSASVEEIGASIREVEEHARESSKMAGAVQEITSDTGMMTIMNAVEGMDNIATEVQNSFSIVQRLESRSTDIEKVLSVIKDVTEQTSLLSLNAAILAAQAGEYGKSFSVVADEISALSDRTASSTREIGGIVKTIQRDIKDASFSIDSAKAKVEEGNGLVIKVGEVLREILTASEHSTDMTKAIERATEEQSRGLKQITGAIDEIRKMMKNIAKSTGEQERALSFLLDSVGEVKEVADMTRRGTEEQAIGTKGISRNLELANEKISRISHAVVNQQKMNDTIVTTMEQINSIGSASVKDMEEVSSSLLTLSGEIEILRKEMEGFKLR